MPKNLLRGSGLLKTYTTDKWGWMSPEGDYYVSRANETHYQIGNRIIRTLYREQPPNEFGGSYIYLFSRDWLRVDWDIADERDIPAPQIIGLYRLFLETPADFIKSFVKKALEANDPTPILNYSAQRRR